jgi:His-Xaa-Ser system radical SAM maturase HxsB
MDYIINNYRIKKFDDKYFLTTDHGSYLVLSEKEFKKLKQNNLNQELYDKLEEKEIILNSGNIDESIRLMRNRKSFIKQGTSLHIMVLTLRCNMKCVYCHASSKDEKETSLDMDKETAKNTVDFIFQSTSNAITIEFQGGEPTLNWEILKYVVKYAKEKNEIAKKNFKITIVTNMASMTEEKMNFLIENKVGMCTSLDGPKEVHDKNRIYFKSSNYDQVIYWMKKFNEEYKKKDIKNKVNALVTLTKKSLNYSKEIVDEYVNLGLKDIHLRFLNNLGVAKQTWKDINYTEEEYLEFWKKSIKYIGELNKKGIFIKERMDSLMKRKLSEEFDPNYLELRSPCGASIGQLTYNYDGNIYTCDEGRMIGEDLFLLGNVNKEDKYKDVLTSDKACAVTNASINDQYICDNCIYKPYCGICPVCNYSEQGSLIAKIPVTSRCKIYMGQFDEVVKENFINH